MQRARASVLSRSSSLVTEIEILLESPVSADAMSRRYSVYSLTTRVHPCVGRVDGVSQSAEGIVCIVDNDINCSYARVAEKLA